MKKLLTDRRFAAGVLAAVILVFTPIGAKMSLARAVDKVESSLAIDDYMFDSMNAARNLVTLGSSLGIGAETDELRTALRGAEKWDSLSVSEKAAANRALAGAFDKLCSAISALEPDGRDAESLEIYLRDFDGPQAAIGRSGYNDAVDKFIDGTYGKFPTKLLGSLFGVEPPEYFN